jgi:V/A-type H+/Na+-transporting ATPase subunit E
MPRKDAGCGHPALQKRRFPATHATCVEAIGKGLRCAHRPLLAGKRGWTRDDALDSLPPCFLQGKASQGSVMPEELQSLLERIQKEGIDKAQVAADGILAAARAQAAQIVREAEQKARGLLDKANQDGEVFAERGRKAVEQAARDIVITIHEAVQATFRNLVGREVRGALGADTVKQLLGKVVEAYCRGAEKGEGAEALVEPGQQKEILDYFTARYAQELRNGLEIKADESVVAGFKVRFAEQNLEIGFTGEAITEALCRSLRPQLAEIVKRGAPKA